MTTNRGRGLVGDLEGSLRASLNTWLCISNQGTFALSFTQPPHTQWRSDAVITRRADQITEITGCSI